MDKKRKTCFQWGVYLVDLGDATGSVQGGIRPCICVSNDTNNTWSSVAQFIPLTSQYKKKLPIHYILSKSDYKFLKSDSVTLTEQLTTQCVDNVARFIGRINEVDITNIKECIRIQLDI